MARCTGAAAWKQRSVAASQHPQEACHGGPEGEGDGTGLAALGGDLDNGASVAIQACKGKRCPGRMAFRRYKLTSRVWSREAEGFVEVSEERVLCAECAVSALQERKHYIRERKVGSKVEVEAGSTLRWTRVEMAGAL